MMRNLRWFSVALATLALAACGGGSSSSSNCGSAFANSCGTTPGGTTAVVASLTVTSSATSIPGDGTNPATIAVVAKDANNNTLSGVNITFSASAGNLTVSQAVTDATGTAKATLAAGTAATGTAIKVTATVTSVTGSTTVTVANVQQTLTLLTNLPQIPSDGSKPATITGIVRDANNQLLAGVVVHFQASSGAIAPFQTAAGAAATPQVIPGTTDANGQAQASLSDPGDPTNRTITVTATLGTGATSATVAVLVKGTQLTVNGPASLILGSKGTFTVALTDSGGNPIAQQSVNVASALGNMLSAASVMTNTTGHATFTLTATMPGTDTVTGTALGLTSSSGPLFISSQSFAFTPLANTSVNIGVAQAVAVVWTNAGAAVANQSVTFSTTRGTFTGNVPTVTVMTDGTGTATATLSATTAGPAVVSATATGVSTQLALTFVAPTPAAINVQASPATVPLQGLSTITAVVRDPQNNLVQGATVAFQLTDTTGGSLSVATATTNSLGQAQTVYQSTTVASTSNGVKVTATVQPVNGSAQVPPASVFLTVGGQTVFLSLGTGNLLSENTAGDQFIVPFVVQALDSGGNAVPGVTITLTIHSLPPAAGAPNSGAAGGYATDFGHGAYAKGSWFLTGGTPAWAQGNGSVRNPPVYCLNEDVNGTGIFSAGEDLNGNGRLDPADVAAVSPGTIITDNTGAGNVNVTYPEDHALWVQVVLTATATVNGTQSTTNSTFWLPILASKISSATTSPPGVNSPYGVASSCASPN